MAAVIYGLCAAAACLCAWLLLQAYTRSRYRLLLWGGLCFAGLTVNNVLLILDKLVLPLADLSTWRLLVALASQLTLLYGLIWDTEQER
jgi:hypothetical protein